VPLQLFEENEQPVVGHPLRIEDPVEVIAFVLDDPGMKALDRTLDDLRLGTRSAIADAQVAWHDAAQSRNGQTAFPTERALISNQLDDRIDQHRSSGTRKTTIRCGS